MSKTSIWKDKRNKHWLSFYFLNLSHKFNAHLIRWGGSARLSFARFLSHVCKSNFAVFFKPSGRDTCIMPRRDPKPNHLMWFHPHIFTVPPRLFLSLLYNLNTRLMKHQLDECNPLSCDLLNSLKECESERWVLEGKPNIRLGYLHVWWWWCNGYIQKADYRNITRGFRYYSVCVDGNWCACDKDLSLKVRTHKWKYLQPKSRRMNDSAGPIKWQIGLMAKTDIFRRQDG